MPSTKDQIGFRISDEGKDILYALQDFFGVSQAGVFELLLRRAARDVEKTEGVTVTKLKKIGGAGRNPPKSK